MSRKFAFKAPAQPKSIRSHFQTRTLSLEGLETRNLMAANLTASLNLGEKILRIEGTPRADTIEVTNNAGSLGVTGISIALSDGRVVDSVNRSMLTSINIVCFGGDDEVTIVETNVGNKAVPVSISGGLGDDTLSGSSRHDRILGGGGIDTISGLSGNDVLDGGPQGDTILGGLGNDRIFGRDGDDVLGGEEGNDTVDAGRDNDSVWGGQGIDNLIAGDGDDTFFAQTTFGTLTTTTFTSWDSVSGDDLVSKLTGFEKAELLASASGFSFTALNAAEFDGPVKLYGSEIRDFLTGGEFADELYGNDGDDVLTAGGGDDILATGLGFDEVVGGAGVDTVVAHGLGDTLLTNSLLTYDAPQSAVWSTSYWATLTEIERAELHASGRGENGVSMSASQFTGNVTMWGSEYSDVMTGGPNNDTFFGREGDDQVFAGNGTDHIYGERGNDMLWGQEGIDIIEGDERDNSFEGIDQIFGGPGADSLYGGPGKDYIYGEEGGDAIYGDGGNDKLYGNSDWDWIHGGEGDDFLDAGFPDEWSAWGDEGNDFNAYTPIIDGTSMFDVEQGGSPTCWIGAAIASAARNGEDLASLISYRSNGVYQVMLYNQEFVPGQGLMPVLRPNYVKFDGDMYMNVEGRISDYLPHASAEGESWVTIVQRAYLQSRGMSLTDPTGGAPDDVLYALNGSEIFGIGFQKTQGNFLWERYDSLTTKNRDTMVLALNSGFNVVASSEDIEFEVNNAIVIDHLYAVTAAWQDANANWFVQLYNPHGRDSGTPSGDPMDGLVTLSWDEFASSFQGFVVN